MQRSTISRNFLLHINLKVLVLSIVFFTQGSLHGQNNRNQLISLSLNNPTLDQVFNEIQNKTSNNISYNASTIDTSKKLEILFNGAYSISDILNTVSKAADVEFRLLENNISVFPSIKGDSQIDLKKAILNQKITVKGKVLDENGMAIPGVNVIIKDTSDGTVTDLDGLFQIDDIDGDAILVFSAIGYKEKTVLIAGKTYLEVQMMADVEILGEIVITGYQEIAAERANGSFSVVSSKDLDKQISTNIVDKIEGLTTGVSITKDANGNDEINIRGISTINQNAQPLFVVDGVPIEGGLNTVNTFDVESVNVLKDASAASIWGARASNGVIVITTKSGKKNKEEGKATIGFNSNLSFSSKLDLAYLDHISSEDLIDFEIETFETINGFSQNSVYTPVTGILREHQEGRINLATRNNLIKSYRGQNNLKQIEDLLYQNSVQQQYNFSYSWHRNKRSTFASISYIDARGQFKGSNSNSVNLNLNETFGVSDKLSIGFRSNINFAQSEGSNAGTNVFSQASYVLLRDANGNDVPWFTQTNPLQVQNLLDEGFYDETVFYLRNVDLTENKTESFTGRFRFSLDYNLTDWLDFKGQVQYELRGNKFSTIEQFGSSSLFETINNGIEFTDDEQPIFNVPVGDRIQETRGDLQAYTVRGQLNFNKDFGEKHSISGTIGTEVRDTKTTGTGVQRFGFFSQSLNFPALDQTEPTVGNTLFSGNNFSESQQRFFSLFMASNYTYDRKYDLSVSTRVDQGNLFGVNQRNRYRPLWSVGAGWSISNEPFFNSAIIDRLKLRLTVGKGGLAPTTATAFLIGRGLGISTNVPGQIESSIFNSLANPDLKWEQTTTYNSGLDIALFNNRLSLTFEAYARFSEDLLSLDESIDPTNGVSSTALNIGEVENKGIEMSISGDIIDTDDLRWTSSFNFSYNRSEITRLRNIANAVGATGTANNVQRVESLPLDALFSWRYAGLNDRGRPMVLDQNNVATSSSDIDNQSPNDILVYSGTIRAPYTSGFSNTITYKGLSLSVLMVYNGGHVLRNDVPLLSGRPTGITHQDLINRWRQSGDENTTELITPRYDQDDSFSAFNSFWQFSDVHVKKADYIKVRNINLAYNLPSSLINKLPFKEVKAEFQVRNAGLLWTANGEGIDPERHNLFRGRRRTPTPTRYTLGLNIKL